MKTYIPAITAVLLVMLLPLHEAEGEDIFPGADESTPSRCMFFDWINSQYEGTTEEQALINLEFFHWLHREYGMALDIYSLDVGNIDDGPYTAGVGRLIPDHYGTTDSIEFRRQFPNGFGPLVEKAAQFGCRLGIWLGPDGYGDTPEKEKARFDMLVSLCRDFNFMLFKFDSVAGNLPEEKQDIFIRTLVECRKHCPDLIALNERLELGKAKPYVSTLLWEGIETYIDVFNNNQCTAPHHRAGVLERPLPPGLSRLIEDHGVCLSSCMDYWEDDLVLQAFNRCLLLAPEIYGNPWLLSDDEFPKLARICNVHHRFREILVQGKQLPEAQYGPFAMSRGNNAHRFLTLRNLSWYPVTYKIKLDHSLGLAQADAVTLRRFHPSERIIGTFTWGAEVPVKVQPFRSCLIAASTKPMKEVGVKGCDYEVICDLPVKPVVIKLLGSPGTQAPIALDRCDGSFIRATLNGESMDDFAEGQQVMIGFPGEPLHENWHRKIADLKPCLVPEDAEALYEATCFAADNNALEVRSLLRSGPTRIPQVAAARKAYFEKPMFVRRGIWDKNLFDGDMDTYFHARYAGGVLRVDLDKSLLLDTLMIRIKSRHDPFISKSLHAFSDGNRAEVSADLVHWVPVGNWSGKGSYAKVEIPEGMPVRYLRVFGAPVRIAEVEGFVKGRKVDSSKWRASNLFESYAAHPATHAWSHAFTLDEVPEGSYLALALSGRHGDEGAYAALRVGNRYVGAPDRTVSFPCNPWEYLNVDSDSNYTFYFPLTEGMAGNKIEAVVLVLENGLNEFKPELFITAYPPPMKSMELKLYRH